MADDPKEPYPRPPLADKGDARPLTQGSPGADKAAGQGMANRPSGLHTRPDLYGARAVIRRPVEAAPTASGDADRPAGGEPAKDDPQREAAGSSQESGDQRAVPEGIQARPAANLLDHPPRMPESVTLEDWIGGSRSEPEDGARAPRGESAAPPPPPEPKPAWRPAPRGEPAATAAHLRKDEAVDPGRTPSPPEAEAGPVGKLLTWMREEADIRRLREDRWPLAVAAVSGAALLLAVIAGGIMGLSGDDEETVQQAQGLDAPASDEAAQQDLDVAASDEAQPTAEDPAQPSQSAQRDVPIAPAGSNFGVDQPARPDSERSGAVIADRSGDSQIAALPDSRGAGAPAGNREPIVDFMRIDPDGKAVVAGRASPGTELVVLDNGEPLGSITADIYGLWTFVSQDPLASGRHEIGLRVKRKGSEVSDPTLVTDSGPAAPGEPEATAEMPALAGDGASDEAAGDQLAAAVPASPVESDETVPQASTEPTTTEPTTTGATDAAAAAPEPAAAPEAAAVPPAKAEASAEPADQSASETASDGASKAAETTAEAASSERVQTAAATPAKGDYVVQLASFKNPETAVREQTIVEEKFSDLLTGHEVFVQQVDLAEQGTYYRVRLGPFANLADARDACARFQERDHDCLALAR